MNAKYMQREFGLGLPPPLNLTDCTSFVLSEEEARRRLVLKKIRQESELQHKRVFNEAGRYGPFRSILKKYLQPPWDLSILDEGEKAQRQLALLNEGQAKINCTINADAIASFKTNFSHLHYLYIQRPYKLAVKDELVTVKVNPNFHLVKNSRLFLVKLRCAKDAPSKAQLRFIHKSLEITYLSQLEIHQLPPSSIFCIDLASASIIECPKPKPFALDELKRALKHYQALYNYLRDSHGSPGPRPLPPNSGTPIERRIWQPRQLSFLPS